MLIFFPSLTLCVLCTSLDNFLLVSHFFTIASKTFSRIANSQTLCLAIVLSRSIWKHISQKVNIEFFSSLFGSQDFFFAFSLTCFCEHKRTHKFCLYQLGKHLLKQYFFMFYFFFILTFLGNLFQKVFNEWGS